MLRFNVSALLGKSQGRRQQIEFNDPLEVDEKELKLLEPVRGMGEFTKLPYEILATVCQIETTAQATCVRCLVNFPIVLKVNRAEREFVYDAEKRIIQPDEEVFFVDRERREIELGEMLRQELLLHFPVTPVCSDGCKGLCSICFVNRNKVSCSCKEVSPRINLLKI